MSSFFAVADLKNFSRCNVIQQIKNPRLKQFKNCDHIVVKGYNRKRMTVTSMTIGDG